MATKERPARKQDRRASWGRPVYIDKQEIAHHLCVSIGTIDEWIKEGSMPPPRVQPGERKMLWFRRHWDHFIASNQWPSESFVSCPGGGPAGD